MQVTFKAAGIADETLLHKLRAEFQAFAPFPAPLDDKTNKSVLRQLIENQDLGKVWLISGDGETAGYAVVTFGFGLEYAGRDALIDELFLREQFRGKGIGKLALNFISQFCATINVRAIHLEVEYENRAAFELYQKAGFINHKRYFLTKWID